MPEPVAEVVLRAQIASAADAGTAAEVRRLVPAVSGCGQRRHDELEVRLHRLGLALELPSVSVREARARLRFQLVRGEMLRREADRLGEVAFEVGGALARDAVDEVERDVVESGITENVDGASDVVRSGNALEHAEQPRLERLRAERDAVDAVAAQEQRELGRDRLGVRLDGRLRRGRQRREETLERARLGEAWRTAPEEHGVERGREQSALELELGEQRIDVWGVLVPTADGGDEVAVPAAVRAERQVDVEVTRAVHAVTSMRRGRATSSPPQLGQTCASSSPQSAQNVHS